MFISLFYIFCDPEKDLDLNYIHSFIYKVYFTELYIQRPVKYEPSTISVSGNTMDLTTPVRATLVLPKRPPSTTSGPCKPPQVSGSCGYIVV